MSEILSPLLAPIIVADPLDRGLVGEWRFDRDTGLLLPDYSGHGLHATISGAVWVARAYGTSLYFDGSDDYALIPHSSVQNPVNTGGQTIEIFYRYRAYEENWQGIISKPAASGGLGDDGWRLQHDSANPPHLEYATGFWRLSATALTANVWYHIVATCDGSVPHIYLNGILDDDAVAGAAWYAASNEPISVARRGGNNDRYNPCDIALVRLYGRHFSAAEAAKRYEIVTARGSGLHVSRYWDLLWGIGEAAGVDYPVSLSLSRVAAMTAAGQAATGGSALLSRSAGISDVSQAAGLGDVTLGRDGDISASALAAALATASLARIASLDASGQVAGLGILDLGRLGGISTAGGATALASILTEIFSGLTLSRTQDFPVSFTLARDLGIAGSAQAEAAGSVALARQQAISLIAQALALADVDFALTRSVVISGVPTIVFELPSARVHIVLAERRIYVIPMESRTYIVPEEDRDYTVPEG